MGKDYQTIVKEIDEHLGKSGRRYYSDFYVGVTNDVEKGIFKKHHVPEDSWWIYRTATDPQVACEVKDHYLKLGMRGYNSNDNNTADIVYCYTVSPTTTEYYGN